MPERPTVADTGAGVRSETHATRLLALERVSIDAAEPAGVTDPAPTPLLRAVDWELQLGQLVVVQADRHATIARFADCLQGLVRPRAGSVLFMEQDWQVLTPAIAARQRQLLRRVFAGQGWLDDLSVEQNILLGHTYHGGVTVAEERARVLQLARRLGLEDLPRQRPGDCCRHRLKLAQWLRALLRPCRILLLEAPLTELDDSVLPRIARVLQQRLAQGTSIVWLDSAAGTPEERLGLRPDAYFSLRDGRLPAGRDGADVKGAAGSTLTLTG